jgi:hypothetical protein
MGEPVMRCRSQSSSSSSPVVDGAVSKVSASMPRVGWSPDAFETNAGAGVSWGLVASVGRDELGGAKKP